ncbi:hypothetical protein [Pseudaminobacter sp. NGMCC 1.201702]|uniref:hypothetical protein n=1 Tax=Pseudaminobacter sp. NGMCC 1.201702 TaxID=3391825 RepID=UPI0039EF0127
MLKFRALRIATTAAVLLSATTAFSQDDSPESMPDFPGRDETFGYCVGCHSIKVVARQGMDRNRWDETLTWMTQKHNMFEPDADTRKVLLDYLAQAYPPKDPAPGGGWVSPFTPSP